MYRDLELIKDDGQTLFFNSKDGTKIRIYYESKEAWLITEDGYATLTIKMKLPERENNND